MFVYSLSAITRTEIGDFGSSHKYYYYFPWQIEQVKKLHFLDVSLINVYWGWRI